ncbi:MAG: hydroxypyruvate isomerase, partial [Bacteroidetes bacterium]|nr:hydroxypyruvate isomerase [Bacteroidota bacterium]
MTFDSGRRSSFKKMLLGSAAMGTLASLDFKEKEAYALKGNINHGVCAWSMRPLSLEELCAQIKSVGVGAIDLISPDNWGLLQKYG